MCHWYKIRGDKWGFYRTDILQQILFPKYQAAFIYLNHWFGMPMSCAKEFVDEPFLIYYSAARDGGGQITVQILNGPARHSLPRWLYYCNRLNECIGWMGSDPAGFDHSTAKYAPFPFLHGSCVLRQWKIAWQSKCKFLWLAAIAVGCLAYHHDRQMDCK